MSRHGREFNYNFNAVSLISALVPRASLTTLNVMGASSDLTYPRIFNIGNLPWETSVTPLNRVTRDKRAIYHSKTAPCNRAYCLKCIH